MQATVWMNLNTHHTYGTNAARFHLHGEAGMVKLMDRKWNGGYQSQDSGTRGWELVLWGHRASVWDKKSSEMDHGDGPWILHLEVVKMIIFMFWILYHKVIKKECDKWKITGLLQSTSQLGFQDDGGTDKSVKEDRMTRLQKWPAHPELQHKVHVRILGYPASDGTQGLQWFPGWWGCVSINCQCSFYARTLGSSLAWSFVARSYKLFMT